MWYGDDDPTTATTEEDPARTALINEIRHLEKSTNEALRSTQDELERLESTSSQTRSQIDQYERRLKVLEKQQQKKNGHRLRGSTTSPNGGRGVNKKLNSLLKRSVTITGGGEQLEELRKSFRRTPSMSNLRGSVIENSSSKKSSGQDGTTTTNTAQRRSKTFRRSTLSSSNNTSRSTFRDSIALGVSQHSRLTNLLSGLSTHDSGDEESSTSTSFSHPSSSSTSSVSSSDQSTTTSNNDDNPTNSKRKQQQSQINELSKTLQLKQDQLYQLQHDKNTNSSKLSVLQSQLYHLNREYTKIIQDYECQMKLLQDVQNKKFNGAYVDMRCNSVIRAEERLDWWKARIERLEGELDEGRRKRWEEKKNGRGVMYSAAAAMSSPELRVIQDEIRMYQVQIKLHEMCKQKIVDSFMMTLEKLKVADCQRLKEKEQQQRSQDDDVSNTDSHDSKMSNECPTGGEAVNTQEEEDEEDLSYMIGKDEGLSLIHSVEDSDISETASENVDESVVLSTTDKATRSPKTSTRRQLTVLISGGNFNPSQAANQRSALQLLIDLSLPFVTIDGMDPDQRERRNELLGASGIRGNYPQMFVTTEKIVVGGGDDEVVECEDMYLGGYEWLECCDLDELREMLVLKSESDNNSSAGEEINAEQSHVVKKVAEEMDNHLKSLEKAVKMLEGRVKDFEILSTFSANRQQKDEDNAQSMNDANRLSSLASECADILENFNTKTSDMITSSIQMQPWLLSPCETDISGDAVVKDKESIAKSNVEKGMIAEIEQKKQYLTQLEQSRDACEANIELLKTDIESLQSEIKERNRSNDDLLAEIQTKMRMLTKRLEDGSIEIHDLRKEVKDWSSREASLLKSHRARGVGFVN